MSRLDSFIRRLMAQRACLDRAADLIKDVSGPLLELGLGNGRTYDHMRELMPRREIYVFEREVAAHSDCIPPSDYLILGDARETLPMMWDRLSQSAALAGGAVDFIDKSRRIAILMKRIELIAEAQKPLPDPGHQRASQFRLGGLELRFDINRAFWRGQVIELTLTEFRMVSRLAMKPGEDVSYRELYDIVHGKDFVAGYGSDGYRTNVRTFIKRIRKKFRAIDDGFTGIENYASFGYRWKIA